MMMALGLAAQADAASTDQWPRTRAEVERLVGERFAQVDTDHDGAIDQAEAGKALGIALPTRGRGPSNRPLFELSTGADGRPQISISQEAASGGMLGMMFAQIDSNRDGKLQLAEARSAALRRFDMADRNRDGTLSDAELAAAKQDLAPMQRALGL
jgi:Ca2+-binding EF-hand superfamily protein